MFKATPAECELDQRARKLMKENAGLSYAKACSQALDLEADPSLYQKYESELAAGNLTFPLPTPRGANANLTEKMLATALATGLDFRPFSWKQWTSAVAKVLISIHSGPSG